MSLDSDNHIKTAVLLYKKEINLKKVRMHSSLGEMDRSGFQKGGRLMNRSKRIRWKIWFEGVQLVYLLNQTKV